jgi:hypothetical protein
LTAYRLRICCFEGKKQEEKEEEEDDDEETCLFLSRCPEIFFVKLDWGRFWSDILVS